MPAAARQNMNAGLMPPALEDLLAGMTPKEQFDALTGPPWLWWRYCQDVVRAQAGAAATAARPQLLAAGEGRLRHLADDQAGSDGDARSFLESVRMTAGVARVLAGQAGPGGERADAIRLVARYWAGSGLLVPASPGTGKLLSQDLPAAAGCLGEAIQSVMNTLDGHSGGAPLAMVIVAAMRLTGAPARHGHVTRVPVLFDKPDSSGGAAGLLEICELPGGPAGLYPDPEAMSFIRADEEFAGALAAAWSYAIRGRTVNRCVRWRLTLSSEAPFQYIRGGSLGAALAVALREHCRSQGSRLPLWAPARAAFLGLRPRCAITGAIAPGDTLAAVGGLDAKIEAAKACGWRLVAPESNQAAAVHVPAGLQVYWASTLRQAARYARRWRPVRTGLAVVAALALAGTGVAVRLDAAASGRASLQRALAASARAAAESETFDTTDPAMAARLAAAAWRIAPTAQARESLLQAYAQPARAALPGSAPWMPMGPQPVAFSPRGNVLVTASNGDIRQWDAATGHEIRPAIHFRYGGLCAVAYSPDGKRIAVSANGAVRLWDAATMHPVSPPMSSGYDDQGNLNCGLSFSPGGKFLAAAGPRGSVHIWNLRTYQQAGAPMAAGSGSDIGELAYNPAGTVLAAASGHGVITTWSLAARSRIGRPMAAPGDAATLALSPSGTILATAGNDLRFWSVTRHREIGLPVRTGHGGANAVAYSPTEPIVAVASADGTATLWDVATHRQVGPVMAVNGTGSADSVTFSPNGKMLATTSQGITRLWDVSLFVPAGPPLAASKHGAATGVAFAPRGTTLATTGADGAARLWNTRTRRQISAPLIPPGHSPLLGVAFSPGGALLALAGRSTSLWRVATRKPAGPSLPGVNSSGAQLAGPDTVAFSPRGTALAAISSAGRGSSAYTAARVWDVGSRRPVGRLVIGGGSLSDVDALAFSPDGKAFATGEDLQTSYLWNARTWRRTKAKLPVGSGNGIVWSVAFSPDSKTLATASGDQVQLWNVATQQPDGAAITAGDRGEAAVAFSPDGELLATAGQGGTVRLWDVATHQQIGSTMTPSGNGGVTAVAFSPDGGLLATADGDGTVQLADVAFPRNLVSAVCAIAGRSLPAREWGRYVATEPYRKAC